MVRPPLMVWITWMSPWSGWFGLLFSPRRRLRGATFLWGLLLIFSILRSLFPSIICCKCPLDRTTFFSHLICLQSLIQCPVSMWNEQYLFGFLYAALMVMAIWLVPLFSSFGLLRPMILVKEILEIDTKLFPKFSISFWELILVWSTKDPSLFLARGLLDNINAGPFENSNFLLIPFLKASKAMESEHY